MLRCMRTAALAGRFPPPVGGTVLVTQHFLLWPITAASRAKTPVLHHADANQQQGSSPSLPYEPDWSAFSIKRPKDASGSPHAIAAPAIILAVPGDPVGAVMSALRERVGKCASSGSHDLKIKLLVMPDGAVRDLTINLTPAAPNLRSCLQERIGAGFQSNVAHQALSTSAHLLIRGEEVSLVR